MTTGSPGPETAGFSLGIVGIGVDVVVGKVVGVAAGANSVVVGIDVDVVVGKAVGVAAGAISVAVGGFVSSGLGGSFVGVSSTIGLATTLASGVGVSAI
ncbi:MAG: hypothetical protein NZ847_17455 [Acidobacteria bacterium]|nr:hypothetical protein [Acidobacteriota bacterium]